MVAKLVEDDVKFSVLVMHASICSPWTMTTQAGMSIIASLSVLCSLAVATLTLTSQYSSPPLASGFFDHDDPGQGFSSTPVVSPNVQPRRQPFLFQMTVCLEFFLDHVTSALGRQWYPQGSSPATRFKGMDCPSLCLPHGPSEERCFWTQLVLSGSRCSWFLLCPALWVSEWITKSFPCPPHSKQNLTYF